VSRLARKAPATTGGAPANVIGSVPGCDDPARGLCVYLCERCGQPLAGPHDLCDSILHVGADGLGIGHAVRSTDLARLAGAARSALGAR
jgi:hypothetical protein